MLSGATMNIRNLRFSATLDGWHWPPYAMFRRYPSVMMAQYYGHRWYVLAHLMWWEFTLDEAC